MLCTGAPELKLPFTIEPKTPRKIEARKKTLITLTPKNFDIIAESAATRPYKRKKGGNAEPSGIISSTCTPPGPHAQLTG